MPQTSRELRAFSVLRLYRDEDTQRAAWAILSMLAGVVAGAALGLEIGWWRGAIVGAIIGNGPGAILAGVLDIGIVSRRVLNRFVAPILAVGVLAGFEFLAWRLAWNLVLIFRGR